MNRAKANLIFVLCAIYSLIAGLYPFEFSSRTLQLDRELPWKLVAFLAVPLRDVGLDDVLINILYFLPWGALVYMLGSRGSRVSWVLRAALGGVTVSFSIELCQIFFDKVPSIFDVLANTLGSVLGALLCALTPMDVRRFVARCISQVDQSRLLLPATLFLGVVPLLISLSKFPEFGLKLWDWHYTSLLGNAPAFETRWFGTISEATIYKRALAPAEINEKYPVMPSKKILRPRVSSGLVGACTFTEKRDNETMEASKCGLPVNVALLPTSHFRWLHGLNGIDVLKPSVLKSEPEAKELFDSIRGRKELSVEIWIKPPANMNAKPVTRIASVSQERPVNIFTSKNQINSDFHVFHRDSNDWAVANVTEQVHLVVTYKGGIRKLFVNGREYPYANFDLRIGDFIVGFGNNPVARIAYSIVFFFPVSFLFSRASSKRSRLYVSALVVPVIIGVGLLTVTEFIQAALFARSGDWGFIGCGIAVVIAGASCGVFLADTETRCSFIRPRKNHKSLVSLQ